MPVLKSSLAAASLAATLALAGQAGAAVLFSDNFDDVANGSSLAGRTPGTSFNGATWVGPAGNLTGDGAGGIFGNASGGGATAAIDLTAGHLIAHPGIYEISVDITLPAGTSTAASWLGMGFAQGAGTSSINTTGNLVDNNGAPWLLNRRNGAEIVFAGPANTNQALSLTSGSVSTGVAHNFRLVLDTSLPQWTVNGFLDGVQQDLNGAAAGNTYTYVSNPVNTHFVTIGTGFNTTSATGTFDNFLVTGVVPEPATAGLALIGAAGFMMRRRARR